MIPKIIHKIWFDFSKDGSGIHPPKKYIDLENECRRLNPEYKIEHWDEKRTDRFIKKFYPLFFEKYKNYKYPIQKVDSSRYFILNHYRGIYMDMDIKCLR